MRATRTHQRTLGWYAIRAVAVILLVIVAGAALVYLRYRQDMAANEERIARGSKIAETPCGIVEYGEMGEGKPILALHGAGGGYDQGLLMSNGLGSGFRVIAPSRFGYLNTPIPEDSSVEAQADAYVCLLDALGVDRVPVVADSAGGPSALAFALRHPGRVNSLVLVSAISTLRPIRDASSGPSTAMLTDFVYWLAVTYFPDTALSAVGVTGDALRHIPAEAHEEMRSMVRSFQPMSRRMPGMNLDAVQQNLPGIETLPLKDIKAPTLVIHARDDTLVPFAQGQHSADNIPNARLVAFDYGGHLVIVLDEVKAEIREFLAQNG